MASSKRRSTSPTTSPPGRRSSMTAGGMRFRSMKSNGLPFNGTPMTPSRHARMGEIYRRLALTGEVAWPLGLTGHGITMSSQLSRLESHQLLQAGVSCLPERKGRKQGTSSVGDGTPHYLHRVTYRTGGARDPDGEP